MWVVFLFVDLIPKTFLAFLKLRFVFRFRQKSTPIGTEPIPINILDTSPSYKQYALTSELVQNKLSKSFTSRQITSHFLLRISTTLNP